MNNIIVRKIQKGRIKGKFNLKFLKLYWGIISLNSGFITKNQLETSRFIINKYIKKIGIYNICINCTKFLTKKSLKTRMGSGKGSIELCVSVIKRNKILFEISNVSIKVIYFLTKMLSYKLCFKLQFVRKIN
uniref:Large subunit ribosomal protein 16 n=1 Tax=Plasmodium inui TaxID=52288 RepID=A0A4P2V4K5_9APIC|nr:large subunit ribosomal protein 16 [Plasmodium inui]